MGIFSGITDHFKNSEFSVAPNKKLKTLSKEFKAAFNLSLVFYKGNMIAEDNLTLAALNKKTSKDVDSSSKVDLKIKASMIVGDVEDLFEASFGVKVQIKDAPGKNLSNNDLTLGQASRL